ncbi:MAG: hypothetical protein KatS3mg094_416 [Candidatus Parcubacteria bacterium]|nr:MAG: hypothetical protein KatS3mg094_416 [Candidatus Parcubacteria bacterium]
MNQKLNEILKSLREKEGLTQEELAKILQTNIAQIEILEKGEFNKLPKNNLEKILGKYENFFKLENDELKSLLSFNQLHKENNEFVDKKYYRKIKLYNNFQNLIFFIITIFLSLFILYQLINMILPPKIKIIYPPDGLITKEREIKIKGYIDKKSVLFLNGSEVIYDENGYFERTAVLRPGLNNFQIIAKNYIGSYKILNFNVYYQP